MSMVRNTSSKLEKPQPDDVLDLSEAEYDEVLKTPVSENAVAITEKDSKFIAYTMPVQDYHNIRQGYLKIRIIHPKARHIVCAYNLSIDEMEDSNGCDDQEPGAYRNILRLMRTHNITSRVFYVVRYCGKEKLSNRRFECYIEAAKAALIQNPGNPFVGCDQTLREESADKPALNTQQKEAYSKIAKKNLNKGKTRGKLSRNPQNKGHWPNSYRGKHLTASNRMQNYRHRQQQNTGRKRYRSADSQENTTRKGSFYQD